MTYPMVGLGVNSGLADAALLANSIILNKRAGNDHGEALALNGFNVQAKKMNTANIMALEATKKAFEVSNRPLHALRGFTLNLLQESEAVKYILMKAARQDAYFPKSF